MNKIMSTCSQAFFISFPHASGSLALDTLQMSGNSSHLSVTKCDTQNEILLKQVCTASLNKKPIIILQEVLLKKFWNMFNSMNTDSWLSTCQKSTNSHYLMTKQNTVYEIEEYL